MTISEIDSLQNELPIIKDCIWIYFNDGVLADNISNYFYATEIYSPGFIKLLKEYNLEEWKNELTIFRIYLKTKWMIAKAGRSSNNSPAEYDKQLANLKDFINKVSKDEISEIHIISKSKNKKVKISEPSLFNWFNEFIDLDLFYQGLLKTGTLTPMAKLSPEKSKDSRAYTRLFVQKELKHFFLFLTTEIQFKKAVALNFITDFAEYFQLDWNHIQISNGTKPQKYLRNTFDKT